MHGSGAVSCACSLLIRGPILPAVRQKLHLSPCADYRSPLSDSNYHSAALWAPLAHNPVLHNIDVHPDHGDCCICHELERYSTSKVEQLLLPPIFSFSGTIARADC